MNIFLLKVIKILTIEDDSYFMLLMTIIYEVFMKNNITINLIIFKLLIHINIKLYNLFIYLINLMIKQVLHFII